MKRLLVISASRWSNAGCFGATYSSIFGGLSDLEIAHIYTGIETPSVNAPSNVQRFFDVGLKATALSPITRRWAGKEVFRKEKIASSDSLLSDECTCQEKNLILFFRRHHWTWLKWLNSIYLSWFGRWRSPQLRRFVEEFQPEAIWVDATPTMLSLSIALYVKKITGLPMTGYVYDEHYSLKRLRFSPFFWLYKFASRRLIRSVILQSEWFYTISEAQQDYYQRKFGKKCYVITRLADFSDQMPVYPPRESNTPLKLVYTGNLSNGRHEALMRIGKAIALSGIDASLDVYSGQPVSRRLKKALESSEHVHFRGSVPGSKVGKILQSADILVLAEGFGAAYRLGARMAFSTKIVDYLQWGKPILAVGPKKMNSIDYFARHQCGLVAETPQEIADALHRLATDPVLSSQLAHKAWEVGVARHNRSTIQPQLIQELSTLKSSKWR